VATAAARWADQLAAWAIPPEILAAAPESPWGFPASIFRAPGDEAVIETPSRRRALEALPEGGTVLDVGSGGGAGSLPLCPPGGGIVAVDESAELLALLADGAQARGIDHAEVHGRWPDVAPAVGPADVVVCSHVFYNVPDLGAFALALTSHARRRVVVELTASHPLTAQAPLWRHFHGIDRPDGPTADDAVAVLEDVGLAVSSEHFAAPPRPGVRREDWVAFVRRRLCLPAERDAEVAAFLPPEDGALTPRSAVTLWWDGSACD
jgi:SAM-dependent methyltransferase